MPELPNFSPGDLVCVHSTYIAGDKKRVQRFEGIVISKKQKTFTVRKTSGGYGIERIYFMDSPNIQKVEIKRKGRVRRGKLFYLRAKKEKILKSLVKKEK